MTFNDFLLELFYLIDTELEAMKTTDLPTLRSRGPRPSLHDSEVITIELAGEFLGIDADKTIYRFFRRYHRREFPKLAAVDRTTFVRQSANLWRVKQLLHERIVRLLPLADAVDGQTLWLIDSFPLRVCRFKRAPSHKLFRGSGAAFGRDPTGETRFYGFRVHLRTSDRGFCAAATLAPGNVSDWPLVSELAPAQGGVAIGDRNYWKPEGREPLRRHGLELLAPFRKESSDPCPQRSKLLGRLRQIIEPVIGQLATRFHCQVTWARDLWHLCIRLGRKLLSHTVAVLLNWRAGHPPLQLNLLISD